jgi:hypothetical protein
MNVRVVLGIALRTAQGVRARLQYWHEGHIDLVPAIKTHHVTRKYKLHYGSIKHYCELPSASFTHGSLEYTVVRINAKLQSDESLEP